MLRLTLILLFCSTLTLVFSQSQRAEQLRKNVVAISARGEKGFGFITGERNGELFIVTAAHVVENALADRQPVELKFFEDYKKYEANIIRNYPGADIALLAIKKPDYFSWEENCLGDIQVDAPVGFVGRNGEWYFPKGPALGIVNDLDIPLNLIKVDINSISQGSSGAPLISEGGIVGMVLRTDGITAEAVDLNGLRRTLSEYNYFFSLSGASGTSSTPANNRNSTEPSNPDRITDRDGNTYATKIMKDGKRWMTKNLNIKVDDSWCYEDKSSNCNEYGRLYTFEAAKEGCQLLGNGWRLPTDEEWREMAKQYGGADDDASDGGKAAYEALLGNGSSGFAAQLGGWRYTNGSFHSLGSSATTGLVRPTVVPTRGTTSSTATTVSYTAIA
jgi:uncharacterized protein (TIGR02145 family)